MSCTRRVVMAGLRDLGSHDDSGHLRVVVEAPRGSTVKLTYEPSDEIFVFDRALPAGLAYPYNWGFVPGTTADDGDPLDAVVLGEMPLWPGVVVPARPIGLIALSQLPLAKGHGKSRRERNDRVVAVPLGDPHHELTRNLPRSLLRELEEFFVAASKLPRDRVTIEGWAGVRAARAAIARAEQRYRASRG